MPTLPVDPGRYAAFLSVVLVLVVTPGPANLFAVATGAGRGRAAVLLGVAGMNAGTLVWALGAALGLSALILAWPQLLRGLVYVGAAYVAWLGARSLASAFVRDHVPAHAQTRPTASAFRDGFAVQISNPKALLFFTGILPPFLDPARALIPQVAALVGTVMVLDVLAMTAYGLGGAAMAERMAEPRFSRIFAAFVGVLLMTTAALMLLRR